MWVRKNDLPCNHQNQISLFDEFPVTADVGLEMVELPEQCGLGVA